MTYGPTGMGGGFLDKPSLLGFLPMIWGVLVQLIVTVIVTYLTAPPSAELLGKFYGDGEEKSPYIVQGTENIIG